MFEGRSPLLHKAYHTAASVGVGKQVAHDAGLRAAVEIVPEGWFIVVSAEDKDRARNAALSGAEAALIHALAGLVTAND